MLFLCVVTAAPASALVIHLDYTYDDQGFFTAPERRAILEQAAAQYAILADPLAPIAPGPGDAWSAGFQHPGQAGAFNTRFDLVIPEGSIRIFVGGRALFGSVLGFASQGTATATGSAEFIATVATRGQLGVSDNPASDFGPWGGSITFNSAVDWHFGATTTGLLPTQADFLTTATHEIAHLLGIGSAASWNDQIVNRLGQLTFLGPESIAVFGGEVPLDGTGGHWAPNTLSHVGGTPQPSLMDPSTPRGTRDLLTELDVAGLRDIGWVVVPEPSSVVLAWGGFAAFLGYVSRRRRAADRRRI